MHLNVIKVKSGFIYLGCNLNRPSTVVEARLSKCLNSASQVKFSRPTYCHAVAILTFNAANPHLKIENKMAFCPVKLLLFQT